MDLIDLHQTLHSTNKQYALPSEALKVIILVSLNI